MARILFANTTNSPRSPASPPFGFVKPRKSAPTCTVSLASVSTTGNGLSITLSSFPSPSSLSSPTNSVAFPRSIASDTSSCLALLKASPASSPSTEQSTPAQERRKRSTARLLQPVSFVPSPGDSEPARKRPRLRFQGSKVKGSGGGPAAAKPSAGIRTPALTSSDLRFLASVQRSVACGLNARRRERSLLLLGSGEVEVKSTCMFDAQDTLLVSRLKTLLLSRGIKASDLIFLEEDKVEDRMDVDTPASDSVEFDMDLDIESPHSALLSPAPPTSSPPPISRTLPSSAAPPSPRLIASVIMRHRSRRPSRAAGSERNGLGREKAKRQSPLAGSSMVYGDDDESSPSDDRSVSSSKGEGFTGSN